jgi:hypothetical protein
LISALILSLLMPAPRPTAEPKVIIHLQSRALCTTLHKVVVPFVITERKNNEAFKTLDVELGKYRKFTSTSAADIGDNGTNTANGAKLMAAGHMDQIAANMYERLSEIENRLADSYRDVPVGHNPQLDSLRQRVDNIVKLQYALAARYDVIAGKTLDSTGLTNLVLDPAASSQQRIPNFNLSPLDVATPVPAGQVPGPGMADAAVSPDFLLEAPSPEIVHGLELQEVAFLRPALAAVKSCNAKP